MEALSHEYGDECTPTPAKPKAIALDRAQRTLSNRLGDAIERWIKPIERKFNFRLYMVRLANFYWAIPDRSQLENTLWTRRSRLPGIQMNEDDQLRLLDSFVQQFTPEWKQDKPAFGPVDAEILHAMVRRHKPRRVIEIGAGKSTRIIAAALLQNQAETGIAADFTSIDPYPSVPHDLPGLTRLLPQKVQDIPVNFFQQLGSDDILFIDSSHVLCIGSDVQYEFLDIIPSLNPGVIVHVHDIFLPQEYHRQWIMEGRFWAEQYILQAFLAFNDSFEILWGSQYMHLLHPQALERAIRDYEPTQCSPSSFWFRRVK